LQLQISLRRHNRPAVNHALGSYVRTLRRRVPVVAAVEASSKPKMSPLVANSEDVDDEVVFDDEDDEDHDPPSTPEMEVENLSTSFPRSCFVCLLD